MVPWHHPLVVPRCSLRHVVFQKWQNAVCCHVLALKIFEHCTHVLYQQACRGNCVMRILCWLPSLLLLLDLYYVHRGHLPGKGVQKMKYRSKLETESMR